MFKRVSTKYVLSFLMVFLVCVISFGAVVISTSSVYASSELFSSVNGASTVAKITLDEMYENYYREHQNDVLKRDYDTFLKMQRDEIELTMEAITKFNDIGMMIISKKKVVASTEKEKFGLEAPENFDKDLFSSKNPKNKITVGELVDKKSFVNIEKLSGSAMEDNAVLAYSLINTDTELLSQLIWGIMLSGLAIILIGFVTSYLISFHMVRPLKLMSKAAKRFAKGDFDARVKVKGNDEVAELATNFNSMAQSLADLEESRSTFLSNVSHDLRTPLTSISGFIDGILDGTIKQEDYTHYLTLVSVEVKRLARLVRSLLDLSRIQAGDRKFTMVDFNVAETARLILLSFEAQIDQKRLDVEFDCEEDSVMVNADKDAIHQVIYNLVDNAVKFSYEKGKLSISVKKTGKNITVIVYNEGKGIPMKDVPHVFDRFYKADKSRGMDKSGVGLGLNIVKAILLAHGENIVCESEENKYCKFTMTLPKAKQN